MTTLDEQGHTGEAGRVTLSGGLEDEPQLDFPGPSTPYLDYHSIDVLLSLHHPRSDTPAEPTFYVLGQVKELLFQLLYRELCAVRELLDGGEVAQAVWTLRRTRRVIELLTETWDVLGTLAPTEFNAFREHLGQASGFQSYMYRMLEYVLGNKNASLARPHDTVPRVREQVQAALRAPSVYDAAVRLLARLGADIPAAVLERDAAQPYVPHAAVERAWAALYQAGPGDSMFELAEAMMDIAEGFGRWRALHLLTVERIIGAKSGTGGTTGAQWLRRAAEQRLFPELWSSRNLL
ncbi:tryptophan 2,3-dioxygenase family protein [Streptomyces sp. KS 21]|uniref:tryptophan 2,3-dioxygenase n=1 Tax=Streptomyces sp. KS 21 TaxID=2485150 RepID=UPI00106413A9|nr:tryptophan 2,3-dioxygenase family protein [Streptomyces sp. KS 21]TDU73561.1 tryptophan 2,3-dioxygenase [Streptomyces sp. KS 21]